MAYIPRFYVSHTRRVQTLYKKALREIPNWFVYRHDMRVLSVYVRQKFEANRHVPDPIVARRMIKGAEEYLDYIGHPEPIRFPSSFEGVAWERYEQKMDDICLDFWHPLEKAEYPDYFAKREKRKKEFVEWYNKKYGKPKFVEYHNH